MNELTGNQIVAEYVLGRVPDGYVCCSYQCDASAMARYDVGAVSVDGKTICSIPSYLHGGKLPSSKEIRSKV
jgi:hypothetical protein